METTGSGTTPMPGSPRLVPRIVSTQEALDWQGLGDTAVTCGGVYTKPVVAVPPFSTATSSWTLPTPGPAGTTQLKEDSVTRSVTVTSVQGEPPTVTFMGAPG